MFVLAVMIVLGTVSMGGAEEMSSLIDNISIEAIVSMQVRYDDKTAFLDVFTEIINNNDKKLKISDGDFTFFLGTIQKKGDNIADKIELGIDKKHADIDLEEKKMQPIKFSVNLGEDQGNILKSLTHILNCIGKPTEKTPVISIDGNFEVWLHSANKGWTKLSQGSQAKIKWEFRPAIQEKAMFTKESQ
jgi:hypothetical protein